MSSRSITGLLCVCLAVSLGCGRRPAVVAPSGDSLAAAEPSLHSAHKDAPGDPKKEAEGPPFHFPDDAGGALLAKALPPNEIKGPPDAPSAGPRRLSLPAGLDAPPLTLPPNQTVPLHAPSERTGKPLAPHLTVDETLGIDLNDPQPPQPRSFAAGDRIRLPSVDASRPIPLPILAHPTADRASLDDPTLEASADAALAAPMPRRAKTIPYFRVTLPDPFENRRPLSLPAPAEDENPLTGTIHPPKP